MKTAAIAIALALALSTLNTRAQDAGAPPPLAGGPASAPKHGQGWFHLLPPRALEQLKLTADQQKQLADLEADVKGKLEKILTPEQQQQLKQMRPPHPPGGRGAGGPDAGGPGGNTPGGSADDTRPTPPPPPNQ